MYRNTRSSLALKPILLSKSEELLVLFYKRKKKKIYCTYFEIQVNEKYPCESFSFFLRILCCTCNSSIFKPFPLFQLLETIIKNCGDIVHMHIAERDIPHKMAKLVKKKVVMLFSITNFGQTGFMLITLINCLVFSNMAAWFSCQGEDFGTNRYLARGIGRSSRKAHTILLRLSGVTGMETC